MATREWADAVSNLRANTVEMAALEESISHYEEVLLGVLAD